MDVPGLTRLRACPDYDDLTDAEHGAVLDAADLLDELRPLGYGFTLLRRGPLQVTPPAGADKEAKARIAALAPALAYVLRLERWADPLPDACRACGAPVWRYTPTGYPYCARHYRLAAARAADRCGTGRESVGYEVMHRDRAARRSLDANPAARDPRPTAPVAGAGREA